MFLGGEPGEGRRRASSSNARAIGRQTSVASIPRSHATRARHGVGNVGPDEDTAAAPRLVTRPQRAPGIGSDGITAAARYGSMVKSAAQVCRPQWISRRAAASSTGARDTDRGRSW